MKILISDKSSSVCEQILRDAGHDVDVNTGLSPDELAKIIPAYHGLIVRSATKVTREIIDAAKSLKLIGRAGTGVDNIDVAYARERDIVVMNTPGGNSNAVAELTLAQMLNLARDVFNATTSIKAHRWEKKNFKGYEISGKTLGLLGYGRVSRLLGQKALALGMTVLCFDPKIAKNIEDCDGIQLVANVDDVLQKADYLSMNLTRRDDTRNFLGKAEFAKMKRGSYFLNGARGGLVDEKALLSALDDGTLAGAALDVFEAEPPVDFTLIDHPKVICTPHIGAASFEAQENVAAAVARQFADFFAGKGATNAV
ncbi:MAG: hydroxyacid dehydrogenase [Calditrichia bacterium]